MEVTTLGSLMALPIRTSIECSIDGESLSPLSSITVEAESAARRC